MINETLKQQLERESEWKQLLNEESPFYDPSLSFLFVFKPEAILDKELIEAERKDLAAKFDDFVSTWALRELEKNQFRNYDFREFYSSMMEKFKGKIAFFWIGVNGRLQISNWGYAPWKHQEFKELVFRDKLEILDKLMTMDQQLKDIRVDYVKSTFQELVDENNEFLENHPSIKEYEIEMEYSFSRGSGFNNPYVRGREEWLSRFLSCHWRLLSEPVLKDLENTYNKLSSEFDSFSNAHMKDIVTIANYISNDELRAQGESMKNAVIEAKKAVDTHNIETFRTDLKFENHEAEVQKIYKKTIVEPIEEMKKSFDKNKLSEDHVSYDVAKQSILLKREEQKRLEEQRKEEERQAQLAKREAALLAKEKKLKKDLENFMTMLRDSGHGHGHKDREGNEKIWYETKVLAAADAIKLAKKSDRLLKPYRVTLYTPMEQPVVGWFLTNTLGSKETT